MPPGSISREVRGFIDAHIDSVETLEVLLLLKRESRTWTAADVARELRSAPASVEHRLATLERAGLLERASDGEPTYRYAARAEDRRAVEDLAEAYARRRVSVISQIYSKPNDQVTTFADAFRFRRDSD